MIIGTHLYTLHDNPGFQNNTPGIYARFDNGTTLGLVRNSEDGDSAYLAWTPETNTLTIGPAKVSAAISLGGMVGYKSCTVCPLVVPSVAHHITDNWRVRISRLFKYNEQGSGGWHLSTEYKF